MAFPAWASAAISGGAGIGGNLINAAVQGKRDHDARNFARMSFDLENAEAERRFRYENEQAEANWHKMNAYNSPMAQMQRFKEAGLNPALIYGQMGNTPPIAMGNFSSGSGPNWKPSDAQHFDLSQIGDAINSYYQFRQTDQNIKNAEVANESLKADVANKALQNVGLSQSNAMGAIDLASKQKLTDLSVDAAEASLNKMKGETAVMWNRDSREFQSNRAYLREAEERIKGYPVDRQNKELDSQLKEADLQLRKHGVMPGDPWYIRVMLMKMQQYYGPGKGGNEFDRRFWNP